MPPSTSGKETPPPLEFLTLSTFNTNMYSIPWLYTSHSKNSIPLQGQSLEELLAFYSTLPMWPVLHSTLLVGPFQMKSVSIIFSRLSHNTGCTEVLLNSFGPDGTVADFLPNDSWWYELIYATIINLLSLIICIFGAKQFGNVTALVMIVVLLSCLTTLVSFIPNRSFCARLGRMNG